MTTGVSSSTGRPIAPPPVTTSAVPPRAGTTRGAMAHRTAVERLVASYRAIPAGTGVRLAKRTSNLFRPRAAAAGPGLDVSGLDGVITLDEVAGTADVQGMCTYEELVAVTLAKGFMPQVVPQLRTITLGGAVTGLGIESTSFRNGLPHESVLELDVLTGAGDVVTATPTGSTPTSSRPSPTPTGRSATPSGCGSSWSACSRTWPCATSGSGLPRSWPRGSTER